MRDAFPRRAREAAPLGCTFKNSAAAKTRRQPFAIARQG
jgi:hypothetical protein